MAVCADGYATITPLRMDYTDGAALQTMQRMTNDNALCLFIDFQERLVPAMRKPKDLMKNVTKWARCAEALRLPVLLSQQYTRGLGATVPELREALHEYSKLEKLSFSCFEAPGFEEEMESMDGKTRGYCRHRSAHLRPPDGDGFSGKGIPGDHPEGIGLGARKKGDFDTAIRELEKAGCRITTYETLVYQMMRSSRHTAFRRISEIVKE